MTVEIHEHPFDPWQAVSEYRSTRLTSGKSGASAVFVGTMRDLNEGDEVQAMVLEHYPGMTESSIDAIITEAESRWPLLVTQVIHRVGTLQPEDQIVLVIVASGHRDAAFAAAQFIMDYLKTRAVFWKKEASTRGSQWIESTEQDQERSDKWGAQPR